MTPEKFLEVGALLVAHDVEVDVHQRDVGHLHDCLDDPIGDGAAHGAALDGEVDADINDSTVVNVDALEHADLGYRPVDFGIVNGRECCVNGIGVGVSGHDLMVLAD